MAGMIGTRRIVRLATKPWRSLAGRPTLSGFSWCCSFRPSWPLLFSVSWILGSRHGTTFLPRVAIIPSSSGRYRRGPASGNPQCAAADSGITARSSFSQGGNSVSFVYVGTELDLFAAALRWKTYVKSQVAVSGPAGAGGWSGPWRHDACICGDGPGRWVCLEPDSSLADRLIAAIYAGELPDCCEARIGTLADLNDGDRFDTILYMDVLEHIADDRAELARAADQLRPGGHLVVLAPAHEWLFTPFDEAVGHYRRYTKLTLQAAGPGGLPLARLAYLDSVGLLASLGNRLALKSSMPSPVQIAIWDRLMVPLSRLADPLLRYSVGKSVLAVWKKPI